MRSSAPKARQNSAQGEAQRNPWEPWCFSVLPRMGQRNRLLNRTHALVERRMVAGPKRASGCHRRQIQVSRALSPSPLPGRFRIGVSFHGFRDGWLRRAAAPPVATTLRPIRGVQDRFRIAGIKLRLFQPRMSMASSLALTISPTSRNSTFEYPRSVIKSFAA